MIAIGLPAIRTDILNVRFVVQALLVSLFAFIIVDFVYHSWIYISHPYQIDYGEGIILQRAINWTDLKAIYPPFDGYPYTVTVYPPVYIWLSGALGSTSDVGFAVARGLSVFSAGLTVVFIYLIV